MRQRSSPIQARNIEDGRAQLFDGKSWGDKYFGVYAVSLVGLNLLHALKWATDSVDFQFHGDGSRAGSLPLSVTQARLDRDWSKRKTSIKAEFFSRALKSTCIFRLQKKFASGFRISSF